MLLYSVNTLLYFDNCHLLVYTKIVPRTPDGMSVNDLPDRWRHTQDQYSQRDLPIS